jgi:hypothetical protein
MAQFGGINQHDRGPMAVRIISIMGVAVMIALIVVMVMMVIVG